MRTFFSLESQGSIVEWKETKMPYCSNCGNKLNDTDKFCTECGQKVEHGYTREYHAEEYFQHDYSDCSHKSRFIAAILCFFLGYLGIHRFYVGKVFTGILWFFTVGFFGFGAIIDFILIVCGVFRDGDGKKIVFWDV